MQQIMGKLWNWVCVTLYLKAILFSTLLQEVDGNPGDVVEEEFLACQNSTFGCCLDSQVPAHGPYQDGCCIESEFGCCPDNIRLSRGPNLEGCDCESAAHGCCPDGKARIHYKCYDNMRNSRFDPCVRSWFYVD